MLKLQIYRLFFSATYAFVSFVVIFAEHISPIFLKTRVIKGHKRAEGSERQRDRETESAAPSKRSALPSAAPFQAQRPQAQRPPKQHNRHCEAWYKPWQSPPKRRPLKRTTIVIARLGTSRGNLLPSAAPS